MSNSNVNVATHSPGVRYVRIDKGQELALYDGLPERWRRLVDSLPVEQKVATVRDYYDKLGDAAGYDAVVAIFRRTFPGWVPPEESSIDRPAVPASRATRAPARRRRGQISVPSADE